MHAPPRATHRPAAPPTPPSSHPGRRAIPPLPHPRFPALALAWLIACLTLPGTHSPAADWPQFLGPNRNGSTSESAQLPWPSEGPTRLWSRPVGSGFSGPVAAGNRVLLHHRSDGREVLECLNAAHGDTEPRWRQESPATYRDDFGFDDGPRATPAVTRDRVVTLGAAGRVTCVDLESGRVVWSLDAEREFGARKGFFGFAASPLVTGDRVIVPVGGRTGAGIVALALTDGHLQWKATDDESGYASPVLFHGSKAPQALCLTREALVVLDPRDGSVRIRHPFRSRQHASVNAATPLVLGPGNRVFLTASYDTGAALLQLDNDRIVPVWTSDESLSCHYASVVAHEGVLYGFHGRQENGPELRAVKADTGRVLWSKTGLGAGTVTLAGNHLLILTERGELLAAPADPTAFRPVSRAQILGTGTRAHPAIAGGRLFARDPRRLVCVRIGEAL